MIGITGTAGKSTCKTLLNELLEVNHTVNLLEGTITQELSASYGC